MPEYTDEYSDQWQPNIWTGENLEELDLKQQRLWQREMFDQMCPLVTVYMLDRGNTELDRIRGEPKVTWGRKGQKRPADRAKRFMPPKGCSAYVDHTPRLLQLTRYGFDGPREVVFTFLDFVLAELNLEIEPGDIVVFENEWFEISDVRQSTESYWVNTEFKFYTVAAASRYRTEGDRKVDYGKKTP